MTWPIPARTIAGGSSRRCACRRGGPGPWTGQVRQGSDGLIWHNHYRLDRTLATIRWQALTLDHLLGVPVAPLICVHGAHIQGGSLRAQGVAIVPPALRHHPKNTV